MKKESENSLILRLYNSTIELPKHFTQINQVLQPQKDCLSHT